MRTSIIVAGILAVTFLAAGAVRAAEQPLEVNDANATESLAHWNNHYVPSLALSDDAKVGKHSIVGDFEFTQSALFCADMAGKTSFDLTGYSKLRFWAKASKKTDNLLVMLMTNGFEVRRDAVVELNTEWTQYELAFDEATFNKNAAPNADFGHVSTIAFYYNDAGMDRIWIDGLEFVKAEKAPAAKP